MSNKGKWERDIRKIKGGILHGLRKERKMQKDCKRRIKIDDTKKKKEGKNV